METSQIDDIIVESYRITSVLTLDIYLFDRKIVGWRMGICSAFDQLDRKMRREVESRVRKVNFDLRLNDWYGVAAAKADDRCILPLEEHGSSCHFCECVRWLQFLDRFAHLSV